MIYDKNYDGPGALLDQSLVETDEEKAKKVEDLINKIGTVTLDSLDAILAAEEAYNNLSSSAKKLVDPTIYQKLLNARAQYNKLYEENAVSIVIELINKIGTVTLEKKALIEEAERAYNNLTPEQKAQVTNYNKLVEAYQDFLEIESAPSNPQNPTTPPKEGLSTGALVAIICGSVVGVALVGAGCFLVIKKLKQSKGGKENEENN
jgi:hypothetical protein